MEMGIAKARRVPGVSVGDGYVSVQYSGSQSGCFDWYVDIGPEEYAGVTPRQPGRYMDGASLSDGLVAVLYCLMLQAHGGGIHHYVNFPYPVKRWAVENHEGLKRMLEVVMADPHRRAAVTMLAVSR